MGARVEIQLEARSEARLEARSEARSEMPRPQMEARAEMPPPQMGAQAAKILPQMGSPHREMGYVAPTHRTGCLARRMMRRRAVNHPSSLDHRNLGLVQRGLILLVVMKGGVVEMVSLQSTVGGPLLSLSPGWSSAS